MNPLRFFRPIYLDWWQHLHSLAVNSDYRAYWRLEMLIGNRYRYTPTHVHVNGLEFEVPDAASFLSAYREIFVEHIYSFRFKHEKPRILDLGANIGLSVLYCKKLYPGAQIVALEADPQIFSYLEKNVHGNGYTDVSLVNAAAWTADGVLSFSPDGADGGRVMGGSTAGTQVPSVDVRSYLTDVDFLKIDIEGAECVVLPACKGLLKSVSYVFVEYHSRCDEPQNLQHIITTLADEGFQLHIENLRHRKAPFEYLDYEAVFPEQLNIFGWRGKA